MGKYTLNIEAVQISWEGLTKKATKIYEKNISLQAKNNPKVFWKFVGSKTKIKSKIPNLYTTKDEDPDMMTGSDQEKAETLRNFFLVFLSMNLKRHGNFVISQKSDIAWILTLQKINC